MVGQGLDAVGQEVGYYLRVLARARVCARVRACTRAHAPARACAR